MASDAERQQPDDTEVTAVVPAEAALCWLDDAVFTAPQHGQTAPISLAVAAGEIVVVQGGIDGGESLTLMGAAALATLSAGEARLFGRSVGGLDVDARLALREQVAYASIHAPLLSNLTVLENAVLPLVMRGVPEAEAAERAELLLHRFELDGAEPARPADLPEHQHRAAIVVRALAQGAKLLLLDEPERGLSALGQAALNAFLAHHVAEGGGALLSTESLTLYSELATRTVSVRLANERAAR